MIRIDRSEADEPAFTRAPTWRREDHAHLVEALETATAEKTVLEGADRERHRLRPLSEWTEADGEVIWYVNAADEYPVVASLEDLEGDEQNWLPLPDSSKLWSRPHPRKSPHKQEEAIEKAVAEVPP